MTSFEEILNAVIPWAILIVGVYLLYRPLAKPLSGFGAWLKRIIRSFTGKEDEIEQDYLPISPANLEFE